MLAVRVAAADNQSTILIIGEGLKKKLQTKMFPCYGSTRTVSGRKMTQMLL